MAVLVAIMTAMLACAVRAILAAVLLAMLAALNVTELSTMLCFCFVFNIMT